MKKVEMIRTPIKLPWQTKVVSISNMCFIQIHWVLFRLKKIHQVSWPLLDISKRLRVFCLVRAKFCSFNCWVWRSRRQQWEHASGCRSKGWMSRSPGENSSVFLGSSGLNPPYLSKSIGKMCVFFDLFVMFRIFSLGWGQLFKNYTSWTSCSSCFFSSCFHHWFNHFSHSMSFPEIPRTWSFAPTWLWSPCCRCCAKRAPYTWRSIPWRRRVARGRRRRSCWRWWSSWGPRRHGGVDFYHR